MEFDRLPNGILEDIISRLPTVPDSVQTSRVSRGWRHRWQSIPRLAFDPAGFPQRPGETTPEYGRRLARAVDRTLLLHAGPIHEFKLCIDIQNRSDVDSWLLVLSRKGVKRIVLRFRRLNPNPLPTCLFECELLRRLELSACVLKLPEAFTGLRDLVTLHLSSAYCHGNGLDRLISKCPVLEELRLSNVAQPRGIRICAPRLRKLTVVGDFRCLQLKNTPVLATAYICHQSTLPGGVQCVPVGGSNLAQLCSALPQITSLVIKGQCLKLLSAGDTPDQLPPSRLKDLTMDVNFVDLKECMATRYLLRSSCGSLEKLKIHHQPSESAGTGTGAELVWEAEGGPDNKFDRLICMEIAGVVGLGSEMALLRFILGSAANLFSLNVALDKKVSHDLSKSNGVAKDLLSYPRASPRARIILLD